jgi:hypothetical protein
MKKNEKQARNKLALNMESLRELTPSEQVSVVGGNKTCIGTRSCQRSCGGSVGGGTDGGDTEGVGGDD